MVHGIQRGVRGNAGAAGGVDERAKPGAAKPAAKVKAAQAGAVGAANAAEARAAIGAKLEAPAPRRARGAGEVGVHGARGLAVGAVGPYADLAKLGSFEGFVKTESFGEIYVKVKLGPDAAKLPPVVYLGGIAACGVRSNGFEEGIQALGQSVITLVLPGQGETLAKDIEAHGRAKSLDHDITAKMQADAVVELLDALGVAGPAHVTGLSYGGFIAAACKKEHPDRFDQVMCIAPYVMSQAEFDPQAKAARDLFFRNPFNPFSLFAGPAMERQAVRSSLDSSFKFTWPVLENHRKEFIDALTSLTMGIDRERLADTVKGMSGVSFLCVPADGASPPELGAQAFQETKQDGVFMMAPEENKGKHDLIGANPALCAAWVASVMKAKHDSAAAGN